MPVIVVIIFWVVMACIFIWSIWTVLVESNKIMHENYVIKTIRPNITYHVQVIKSESNDIVYNSYKVAGEFKGFHNRQKALNEATFQFYLHGWHNAEYHVVIFPYTQQD